MPDKILVVFHLYYNDQVDYFITKMRDITDVEWDLVVTGSCFSEKAVEKILEFKPQAKFLATDNVGYDIWPFIQCIKSTDLSQYLFVIKLHTKNNDTQVSFNFNGIKFIGDKWRDTMVDALLGSSERFKKNYLAFCKNPELGLVYAMDVNSISRGSNIEDSRMLTDELTRLGIEPAGMGFCAGTMFAARASALEFLNSEKIVKDIFPESANSHNSSTITHAYERILCIAVTAQGYKTKLIRSSIFRHLYLLVKWYTQPVLSWIFEINYYGEKHEKFMTIFGIRIKLS